MDLFFCKTAGNWDYVIFELLSNAYDSNESLTSKEMIQIYLDLLNDAFGESRVGMEVVKRGFRPRHLDKRLAPLLRAGMIRCDTHDKNGNKYTEKKWRL